MNDSRAKAGSPRRKERRQEAKALRGKVPFASHATWTPAADRPDPLVLLQAQDAGRLPDLLPIKYGRMVASPFAFLRGSAVVMASDLSGTPVTGIQTMLCGDAHLSNFGVFATPERKMVFDVNDFDEAFPGPWEWDVKRLAASAVVAGRQVGLSDKVSRELAVTVATVYGRAISRFSTMRTLDVWYYQVDTGDVLKVFAKSSSKKGKKGAEQTMAKARTKTQEQTLESLTSREGGRRRIVSDPPLLMPFGELDLDGYVEPSERQSLSGDFVRTFWSDYLDSLPDERRYLLRRFRITDGALRVGGIGSVGTRCLIALLEGGADDDALILQLKEANASVLQAHLPKRPDVRHHAQRVVTAQRLMQAASDMFLGWNTNRLTKIDYYWRQLKDMKGSFDVAAMDMASLKTYAAVCAGCLARAHARTGDPSSIAGYLGKGKGFADAIGGFAVAYADQNERDHQALVAAVKEGRIVAETGV